MLGKLRVLSGREVCKILEQNSFVQVRQRGSHIIMQLQTEDSTVIFISTEKKPQVKYEKILQAAESG